MSMWGFELSITVILGMIALSQCIVVKSRGVFSLQFALGVLCMLGFGTGVLSPEIAVKSKMIEVGIIAYSVLLIHGGTLVDLKAIKTNWKMALLCVMAILSMVLVLSTVGTAIFGKPTVLLSLGSVIGGGATAAIVSNGAMAQYAQYAALPWLIFMLQGFVGLPIFGMALKRAASEQSMRQDASAGRPHFRVQKEQPKKALFSLPTACKGTAYYLFILMTVALINRLINQNLLGAFNIHPGLTALLLGIVLGQVGIIERDSLAKADALGFLMLGLMTLMVATLAQTPMMQMVSSILPALCILGLSACILVLVGYFGGKWLWQEPFKGVCITMSCMVGFPTAPMLVRAVTRKSFNDQAFGEHFESKYLEIVQWTGCVVVNALSVLVGALALKAL